MGLGTGVDFSLLASACRGHFVGVCLHGVSVDTVALAVLVVVRRLFIIRSCGRRSGSSLLLGNGKISSGVIVYLSRGWAVPPAFLQRRGCSRDVNTLFEEVMSHAHARHALHTHAVCQCAARQQLWPVSHRVTL